MTTVTIHVDEYDAQWHASVMVDGQEVFSEWREKDHANNAVHAALAAAQLGLHKLACVRRLTD